MSGPFNHLCSECGIDDEELAAHHTVCEGLSDCTIRLCDPCRMKLIMRGEWIVCEPHDEGWEFDKCKTCYDIERNPTASLLKETSMTDNDQEEE